MRLVSCVAATVLVLTLLFNFVISPLAGKISGKGGGAVQEVKAETVKEDETHADRVPVKNSGSTSKAGVMTVGWQEDEGGRWYQNADGTFYAGGMAEIDGSTYCFDENGYMQTGWVTIDGVDYMFNNNGVYDPNQHKKMVALTFDDGPGQYTMELLNCLEENDARATFFMQGINAQQYPDEIKKMKEIGCELGNHSYDHPQLPTLSPDQVKEQFEKTSSIIEDACGSRPTVARTPFGLQDEDILSYIGMPCFMWNIDTLDWKTKDADNTYNVTMDNVSDGDIVLMHDIHEPSVQASLRIIPALVEQGYKLVTVSELARAKGVTLEAGKSYTDFCDSTVAALLGSSSSDSSSDEEYSEEDSSYDSSEDSSEDVSVDSSSYEDSSEDAVVEE
ncbi:MAG: polysaccharide deacetylase family protein [Eubacteriales bacterium]|nr:polysaccharide deacetylase family protein [Eubacteriales bacterium]